MTPTNLAARPGEKHAVPESRSNAPIRKNNAPICRCNWPNRKNNAPICRSNALIVLPSVCGPWGLTRTLFDPGLLACLYISQKKVFRPAYGAAL